MSDATSRTKKSNKLEPLILKELNKYVRSFDTIEDCLEDLGISRNTLERVQALGRCSAATKEKILVKLTKAA